MLLTHGDPDASRTEPGLALFTLQYLLIIVILHSSLLTRAAYLSTRESRGTLGSQDHAFLGLEIYP